MNLAQIIQKMNLKVLTETKDFAAIEPQSGYCSDLLSCVMAGAQGSGIWITLQSHMNIIAVAALLDLSAIIITEDAQPDANTLAKANEKSVILLSTPLRSYEVAGRLWEMGLKAG